MNNFNKYLTNYYKTQVLDEDWASFKQSLKSGLTKATNVGRHTVDSIIPKDFLPRNPKHEINTGPVQVKKIDANNVRNFQIRPDFHPTHVVKIHGVDHIIGNELGKNGPQVYQLRSHPSGRMTIKNIPSFRLLHEQPVLAHTFIGQSIHQANKKAFLEMPITASKSDIHRVMSLPTTSHVHGVPAVTMQYLAINHPNAGPHVVDALIKNQHADPLVLKKAMTVHGLTKSQAQRIIDSPHISDQVIVSTAHSVLQQP